MLHKSAVPLIAFLALSGMVHAANLDWEPDVYPKSNLFPSLVIGTACINPGETLFPAWKGHHEGDPEGLVGASIAGLHKGDQFKLVVEANDYMKESSFEGVAKKNYTDDLVVHPKISYYYDKLVNTSQVTPLDVTMELTVNGKSQGKQTVTIMVRSINDCLYGVDDGDDNDDSADNTSDYSWIFTSYVNEDHPWVDRILKEALKTGIVSSFDGYQAEDTNDVLLQIFAIWAVMQKHGMHYSDITTGAAETDGVYSQHVRLFDQAVAASQANCVDGSVLLAAVLRKIGLRPSLVIIPGHMFLAVDLDDNTQIGIETTMMGDKSDPPDDDDQLDVFENLTAHGHPAELNSFEAAADTGTDELEKNEKKFESDDLQYQIIDIAEARKIGILPIKFAGPPEK